MSKNDYWSTSFLLILFILSLPVIVTSLGLTILLFIYLLIVWLINESVRFSCDFSKTAMNDIYIYIQLFNTKRILMERTLQQIIHVIPLSSFNFFREMGPNAWGSKSYSFKILKNQNILLQLKKIKHQLKRNWKLAW